MALVPRTYLRLIACVCLFALVVFMMVVDDVVWYDVSSDRQRGVLSLIRAMACIFSTLRPWCVCLTDVTLVAVRPYAAVFGWFVI